jgi:putative membrane protein
VNVLGDSTALLSVEQLPAVNALLNSLATLLLIAGFVLIKRGREEAHKWVMVAAFAVSCLFLVCYLTYHYHVGSVHFQGPPHIRTAYLAMLLTHVVLAATVPFLAGITLFFGFRDRRAAHRRLAKWAFPIWLYVSITGVVIYVMLYHLYPAPATGPIIEQARLPVMSSTP